MTATDDGWRSPTADAPPHAADCWDHADLQRIWLGTQSRAWRTLAVVPVDAGMSSYEAANLITMLGLHQGESVGLADLRNAELSRVGPFLELVATMVNRGQRVVFATRSITENLATIQLARAADAVILCVSIGSTPIGLVEEAIKQIGKDRFIGSMLIQRSGAGIPAVPPTSARKLLEQPS
jgi:hypothetical protein